MDDGNEPHDIDLLLRVRSGQTDAFAVLYHRHSNVILRYGWAQLGDRPSAEDLTQETFTIAWAKRMSASIIGDSLLPWLLTVAKNLIRNELRRRQRKLHRRELPAAVSMSSTMHEDMVWMRVELEKLDPIDREICRLCLEEGLTYKDAAVLVESSEAAVSKRIQRARTRLRVAFGEKE